MAGLLPTEEVQQLLKSVLGIFTTQYTKHYALALVKLKEKEARAEPNPLKLYKRPKPTEDLKSGYLKKEGGLRKSWKKRWFIVRHDYTIEYFADEKASQKPKPKPKGSLSLCGYSVVDDLSNTLLQRVKDLAEKMGMEVSQLPTPKKYPENCFEVHHYRRRSYYVDCASPEEKSAWVEMFRTCCRRAYGLKDREKCHKKAFWKAIRETRWELGRWGYSSYGGSEEQILSDLISDEIDWTIMGRVWSKLSGPWIVRNKARSVILKNIDTLVSAAVTPAWKAMSAAVGELRPKIEPVIGEMVDPLGKAKGEILDKMKDGALGIINPLMDEHVSPHLKKIVEIIMSPFTGSFEITVKMWDEQLDKFTETFDPKDHSKGLRELAYFPRSWWNLRPAYEKIEALYEPLWLLREIFSDIYPWSIIWNGRDTLSSTMDNAFYTFEKKLGDALTENPEGGKEVVEKARASAMKKYKKDIAYLTPRTLLEIIKIIVMPPFNKLVIPACKGILEPLQSAIPDAMKQFIDLMEMFDELLNGIIDGVILNVLSA